MNAELSRRKFLQLSSAAAASCAILSRDLLAAPTGGPATLSYSLDQDWLFFPEPAFAPQAENRYVRVTVPHCTKELSWHKWDAPSWEQVWAYRRHIDLPAETAGCRLFFKFDAVSVLAKPTFNGHQLPPHFGGYLPFRYEITGLVKPEGNVLDLMIDATWQNIPPDGSPKGFRSVDYFEPSGIIRSTWLEAMPQVFLADVFAKPLDVLKPSRRIDVLATIDAAQTGVGVYELQAELMDGNRVVSSAKHPLTLKPNDKTEATVTLTGLSACRLWDVDDPAPQLYTVVTTLLLNGKPLHDFRRRIGFREADFRVDGFYFNGRKMQFFGLDRHEVYPYVGFAMPPRVIRRDAEILKYDFHVNMVRCSHYPQNEAFLDACDELGIMVWQEPPGWQWLPEDKTYQEIVAQNVHDMILRDRSHASIVIWGVRVNESHNDPGLYLETKAIAKQLDGTRPTSGSMTGTKSLATWHQDVFSLDDYHSGPDGDLAIYEPLPGIPYMISETVGQYSYGEKGFHNLYYRGGDPKIQVLQAVYHAQAFDRAFEYSRMNGVIAWCAFEYPSGSNSREGIKNPGVSDHFRLPKLGASFYLAQVDPNVKPVIAPNFYWDFGPNQPKGPGKKSAVFSNCDRLEFFLDGKHYATGKPDRKNYKHIKFPPTFLDLDLDGVNNPELRIEGFVGADKVITKTMSSDPAHNQFVVELSDPQLLADGADAARLAFKVGDKYGNDRQLGAGVVTFRITGPGELLGDPSFDLAEAGGVGAVWIKTLPNQTGTIEVTATHSALGSKSFTIRVVPDTKPAAQSSLALTAG